MNSNRLLLIAAFLFSLGSCSKEVSQETPVHNSSGQGNFYATIDGMPWKGDSLQQVTVAGGVVTITGISKNLDAVYMVLPGLQTGVYAVNSQSPGFALFTNVLDSTGNIYLSNTSTDPSKAGGTVSLTSIDTVNKTISGTFQFKLYQESNSTTKTVTEGVFNDLPYALVADTLPVTPPPAGDRVDTVRASIDGTDWTASEISADPQSGMLILSAATDDGAQINMLMPESVAAGSYPLGGNGSLYLATYNLGIYYYLAQGNGTLTIVENDTANKHIRGNFSFVGQSSDSTSVNISNGYFSVNY